MTYHGFGRQYAVQLIPNRARWRFFRHEKSDATWIVNDPVQRSYDETLSPKSPRDVVHGQYGLLQKKPRLAEKRPGFVEVCPKG